MIRFKNYKDKVGTPEERARLSLLTMQYLNTLKHEIFLECLKLGREIDPGLDDSLKTESPVTQAILDSVETDPTAMTVSQKVLTVAGLIALYQLPDPEGVDLIADEWFVARASLCFVAEVARTLMYEKYMQSLLAENVAKAERVQGPLGHMPKASA